jgi:hypothetical protein
VAYLYLEKLEFHPAFQLGLLATVLYTEEPTFLQCVYALLSSLTHDLCCQRIYQLNTHINNPLQEDCHEIEVTNPTHPLFGRRFPLLFVSQPPHGIPNAFVSYQKYMVLKIPVHDTNLFETLSTLSTKLTLQAINEFISIAKECKELCHIDQNISGMDCHHNSKTRSKKKSHPFYRR